MLPLSACFYPAERGKMLEARVDRLESDKKELELALNKQREKLEKQVEAQVIEVQKALEKLERSAHRTGADIGVQVEQVQTDLGTLRGQVDQYVYRLAELEAQLTAIKDAEAKLQQQKDAEIAAKKPEPVERPTDKKAFAELVSKKLADHPPTGRELAVEWLKKWPKDPLAARVHFELGSSYASDKDWRPALAEFRDIVMNFSKSDKAPDALLKSSECFAGLAMKEEARIALEEILHTYPKSEAAKTAKVRLASMKKKGK